MQSFILKKEGEPTATLNTPQGRNRQKDPRGLLAIASAKEISVDAPEVASSSFLSVRDGICKLKEECQSDRKGLFGQNK